MRKVAATILALALATTHGLLEEGGASKGLRGAEADSSLERAAVGRKLDFYQPYECKPPGLGLVFRTPPGCGLCSDGAPCTVDEGCEDFYQGGVCVQQPTEGPPCNLQCLCPDGTKPETNAVTGKPIPCEADTVTCCDDTGPVENIDQCPFQEGQGPCSFAPTPEPTTAPTTPQPTPCPKKLDVCIAVDESGSICSTDTPELCRDGACTATTCTDTVPPSDVCNYAEDCP